MRAAREQFRRLRRALDILCRDAADQIVGKVLDQANAAARWRIGRISGDAYLRITVGQKVRRKIGHRAVQIDMLDAACDLSFRRIGKLELVEDITRDPVIVIWIPESVEQRAWFVK